MLPFTKAHAYGNDFLYVRRSDAAGRAHDALARQLCDRHRGVGADGLILYEPTDDGASMRLFNADGTVAEVSGNGVRGLAAILMRDDARGRDVTIRTEAGPKRLTRVGWDGGRQTFRAAMGAPEHLREVSIRVGSESVRAAVMTFGNPQCVVLGALPDDGRFTTLGRALERAPMFPERTNVEFANVERHDRIRILIWERGVGPTLSSGTGSCAALIAAAQFGGAARDALVVAPGGAQRVEWQDDSVYLTGWAEITLDGRWLIEESAT
jgi:diaminopimelate epimerase